MTSTLTENIVLARTRCQDLKSVRKLNCWGSELKDVSIVRRMPNVEVLSLSLNKIGTLEDFQYCPMLQELYLRQNEVKDLNQILYLQDLEHLQKLWLADNPCVNQVQGGEAGDMAYRYTVLKHLPQLSMLDNISVTDDERQRAEVLGAELGFPGTEEPPVINRNSSINANRSSHVSQADNEYEEEEEEDETIKYDNQGTNSSSQSYVTVPEARSNPASSTAGSTHHYASSSSPEMPNSPPQMLTNNGITKSYSTDFKVYNGSPAYPGPIRDPPPPANLPIPQQPPYAPYAQDPFYPSPATPSCPIPPRAMPQMPPNGNGTSAASVPSAQVSQGSASKILPKGGKNRNANILSAVLCLIKELDFASLEVVETAIHCRMEEMED